jgi:hypothetical protein
MLKLFTSLTMNSFMRTTGNNKSLLTMKIVSTFADRYNSYRDVVLNKD